MYYNKELTEHEHHKGRKWFENCDYCPEIKPFHLRTDADKLLAKSAAKMLHLKVWDFIQYSTFMSKNHLSIF